MYCNNPFNYLRVPANVNVPLGGTSDTSQLLPYNTPLMMNMGTQMTGQPMPGQMMPMGGQQFPPYTTTGATPMMGTGAGIPSVLTGAQQMMPGQIMPGQVMPGQMMPDQMMPDQMMPGQVMPGQMIPGQMMPGQVMPGQIPATTPPAAGAAPSGLSLTVPMPIMDLEYTQGYLRTQIGRRIRVEFLIGTNMVIDREGILLDVGISYIIINEVDTDDLLLCDIYSIKFVRFYY